MGRRKRELPAELTRLRQRFEAWRRTRRPRSRIPDRLWTLAAKLVPTIGLHRTASTLKLDYYSLKEHVETSTRSQNSRRPTFVELPRAIAPARECVIEFDIDAGVSMRVHLKGYEAPDIATLTRSFRNAP